MKFFVLLLLLFTSGLALGPASAQKAAMASAVTTQPQSRMQIFTITRKGKTSVRRRIIPFVARQVSQSAITSAASHSSTAALASGTKSIATKAPAATVSTPKKSQITVHPRFGGTVVSEAEPSSTSVGGTPTTVTVSYPIPDSGQPNFALFAGINFSIQNIDCNSDECGVTIAFKPLHPGLLSDAVLATDSNGNLLYETFLGGVAGGPQFGFDFGNETDFNMPDQKPAGITVGPDGNYYYSDQAGMQVYKGIRDPNNAQNITSFVNLGFTALGTPAGVAVDGAGTVYVADQTNNVIAYMTTQGQQGTLTTSQLSNPQGIAIDGLGNVYICDTGNNRVIEIDNQGNETTIDGNVNSPQAISVDIAGNAYFTDAGGGGEITGYGSDNENTYQVLGQLGQVQGIAVDPGGRIYYSSAAGFGTIDNYGNTTFGSSDTQTDGPYGVAVDNNGDILRTQPADSYFSITDRFNTNSIISTTPGSTATDDTQIENTGSTELTFTAQAIPGPVFTIDPNSTCASNTVLESGQSCDAIVDFTPPDDSTYQETYAATTNSLNVPGSTNNLVVKGFGVGFTTATTLTTSGQAALTGTPVTLTATVANTSGNNDVPTGSIEFTDNGNYLAVVDLAQGQTTVSYTTSSLPNNGNVIQAIYSGDSLFAPSTSAGQNVQIDPTVITTVTQLSVSAATIASGQSETLTAAIGGEYTQPSGTVTFSDQNGVLGTVAVTGNGQSGSKATLTLTTLTVGSHTITATYSGDATFSPSTSPAQTVTVTGISTTTVLTVSPATLTQGQLETLMVTVTPARVSGMDPDGSVNYLDSDGTLIGTSYFSGYSLTSQLLTSSLTVGRHVITAVYSGDQTYSGSTSGTQVVTVIAASTTLSASVSTTSYQTPVTFRVSNGAAHFGQAIICDAAAPQCSILFNLAVVAINSDSNAIATLPVGTIGTHSFIARFLGTAANDSGPAIPASTSTPITVTVTGTYPSTTALTAAGTASPYTLTGTVVGFGSNSVAPTGKVTFNDTSNTSTPLLGTANLGTGTLGFTAVQPNGSPVAVGAEPYGVATGDFNGDGFSDLVTENYGDGTISVLLGKGDGTFQPAVAYSVGVEPERVLAADLNGDGILDLVVANTASSSIGVIFGNGDGTFQPQVTYGAGSPVGLGVLDLNNDGFPDIAVGDYYDGTMSVLLNNGDGTFQDAVTYPTASTPQTLAEGDFNGDGNIDIVIGNEGSASISVYLGNGDGTFLPQVTYPVGSAPQGIQVGDFNADGKLDLAVTNSSDATVSILLGKGDGTFQAQTTYPVGATPVPLVIADFNGDGLLDIAVGNTSDNTVGYLLGKGDGTFQPQVTVHASTDPYGLTSGDFNGDGHPDLAASTFGSNAETILLSQITQTATATLSAAITAPGTHNLDAVYAGDTNFTTSTSPTVPVVIATNAVITPGTSTTVANGGTAPGSPTDYTFFGNANLEFGLTPGGQPTNLTNFTVNTLTNVEYPGNGNYTSLTAPGGTAAFTTGSLTENPTNYPNTTPHTHLLATFSPLHAGTFTVYILDGNTDGVYVGNSSVGLGVDGGAEIATASKALSGTNEFTAYTVTGATPSDVFQVYATTSTNAYPTIGGLTFSTDTGTTLKTSATTLIPTPTTQVAGGFVGFTVRVSGVPPSLPAPTGTATLIDTSVTPNVTVGTTTIGGAGTGSVNTTTLSVGTHTIVAQYSGDTVYAASNSAPQTVTITAATPPAVVINSQNFGSPTIAGDPAVLTLTYNVSGGVTPVATIANGTVFTAQPISCAQNACTVQVTFAPAFPGPASDALTLTDANGKLLDKTFLYGTGTGPQLGFDLSWGDDVDGVHTGVIASPAAVAVGPDGNLYITDNSVNKVYQVNPKTLGVATALPIAGLGNPAGIAVGGDHTIYVVDQTNNVIRSFNLVTSALGVVSTPTALNKPTGIAVDGTGALYITDTGNGRILKIDDQGAATIIATGLSAPTGIALDSAGNVFYGDPGSGGEISKISSDGGAPTSVATNLGVVNGIAVEPSGRIFFATTMSISSIVNGVVRTNGYFNLTGNPVNYGMALDQFADIITTNTIGSTYVITGRAGSGFYVPTLIGTTRICCDFISNTGNAPLTIASLKSVGAGFTVDTGAAECKPGQVVQPATTCSVASDFTPITTQVYQNALTVTSNSLNAPGSTNNTFLTGPGQPIATTTALTIAPNPAIVGQTITFTATLAPGTGSPTAPTGSIQFLSGTTVLATVPLNGLTAQYTTAALPVGADSITAAYTGDTIYAVSTSAAQTLTITLAAQTITFPAIPSHTVGDAPFTLAATASSGLPVTYTVTSGPATVSGSTITLTGATGTVTIQASQAGNATYSPAPPVSRTFTVAPSTAISLNAITPNTGAIGSPATTITLTGSNFSTADIVQLNGVTITSTYVSPTSLTAIIPASFFANAGVGQVTVNNPETKVTTAAIPFTVSTAPQIVFTGPPSATSGTQPKLTFTLVNPYPVALAGTLTLTFAPATTTGINDPAVQFATGGRTLAFNIPANSTVTPTVQLQTGTVAGSATIALAVTANGVSVTPANVAPVVITIPPAVPTITSTSLKREGNTLTVSVVGFSNTREALKATFHFTPITGGLINDADSTLDVTSDFTAWYTTTASDPYGSAFTYTQVFNLDQDAAVVGTVKVTLANTVGASTPATTQ